MAAHPEVCTSAQACGNGNSSVHESAWHHAQVGYLLGLGDRHPSNLMLDRYSGKLLHIDFGDCFEASMHREKFPEKVSPAMRSARWQQGLQGPL